MLPNSDLRPLLPRPHNPHLPTAPANARLQPTDGQLVPRRAHTRNACEPCRRRKVKCDGKRPTCKGCLRGGSSCHYLSENPDETRTSAIKRKHDEVQDRLSAHEELFTLLQTRGPAEVTEIIRRVRAGIDVESILRYVKDGDLLLQLHLTPEVRLRYSFPDFASWPTVFRDPDDPYLKTQLHDFQSEGLSEPDGASRPLVAARDAAMLHVYETPFHAAHMVDPRLQSVKAARWTSVTTDDALVLKLLAIYFQYEFPWTCPFPKDLFLEDLSRGGTTFCSQLLVNSILSNAAHGLLSDPRRVESWAIGSLPYAFLNEARRLWDLEVTGKPKLTTIQAAQILCMRYGSDGADKVGVPLTVKAVELGQQLELFTRVEKGDTKLSIGRAFTAWALFNWQGLLCYHQMKTPFLREPPATPLPDYASVPKLTGEIYLKYPLQPNLTPMHFGLTFRAQSSLILIINEIHQPARGGVEAGQAPASLRKAVDFYKRLEAWRESLPEELQASRIVLPHHMHLHMEYCMILINLFEPWLSGRLEIPPSDTHLSTIDGHTIQAIGNRARARLETLIRLYYMRHSFGFLDSILIVYLLILGSMAIRTIATTNPTPTSSTTSSTSTTRTSSSSHSPSSSQPPSSLSTTRDASTFLLCAKGLHDQGKNIYAAALMFDMLAGLVDPTQNQALMADLAKIRAEFRGITSEVSHAQVQMQFPVPKWVHPENEAMGRVLEGLEGLDIGERGGQGRSEEGEVAGDSERGIGG